MTVMSPAVSTAAASAAAAIAPIARRIVTRVHTSQGPNSSSADSSSSGSTAHKPTPVSRTIQGRAASAWTTAAPKRPTRIGRTPSACIRPAFPSAPSQAVACNGNGTNAASATSTSTPRRPQISVRNRNDGQQDAHGQRDQLGGQNQSNGLQSQPDRARQSPGLAEQRRRPGRVQRRAELGVLGRLDVLPLLQGVGLSGPARTPEHSLQPGDGSCRLQDGRQDWPADDEDQRDG